MAARLGSRAGVDGRLRVVAGAEGSALSCVRQGVQAGGWSRWIAAVGISAGLVGSVAVAPSLLALALAQ